MTSIRTALTAFWQDTLLRKVVRNTGYLFSSNTLGMGLGIVQSVFAARLLGVAGFGTQGAVIAFVSSIDRLFSFRMGELVVKYLGQFLAQEKKDHAAAVVKAAALIEAGSGIAAYLVVILLAPLAAIYIIKDPATRPLFNFYALSLFANLVIETATAVLQIGGHFRTQAAINLAQSLLTAAIIVYGFITRGNIWLVLTAYLLGKATLGLSLTVMAAWRIAQMLGRDWWKVSFAFMPPRREFWRFALSSNFSGTVNLVTRDSEVLWVSFFLSPLEAGYYKVALAVINLVLMPINPLINTTFPEIARAVAQETWSRLRELLKKLTLISGAWTGMISIILLLFGGWLIRTFYGAEYGPAAPAALILLIGFGLANTLYWNRPLLLSLGEPTYPLKVMAFAGLVKILMGFMLVPRLGYLAQAALMSAFFIASVSLIVWRGLGIIHRQQLMIR